MEHERIQFRLRALFVMTVGAGVVAATARWLMDLDDSLPLLLSVAIGLSLGVAAILILQNVQVTRVLIGLLICLVACGLWYASHRIAYAVGFVAGTVAALYGLAILNAVFRFCGLTVATYDTQSPSNWID